jgi:hypothetical protein
MYTYTTLVPPTSLDQGWHERWESGDANEVLMTPTIFVNGYWEAESERANLLCTEHSSAEGRV